MYGSKGAEPRYIVAMYRGYATCSRENGAMYWEIVATYRGIVATYRYIGAMYRYIGACIRPLDAMRDSKTCSLRLNVAMYRYAVAMSRRIATSIR